MARTALACLSVGILSEPVLVFHATKVMNHRPLLYALFMLALPATAEEWTRFRGPNGSGISTDTGFPFEFNKSKNLVWRTPVRPGKSSPILTRRHVFLTALENGKLFTQCIDRETGKLLWERSVDRGRVEPAHKLNHPAAITPVTDGETVYAFFPEYGLLAYDANGKERWKAPLGPFSNENGHSSCPIIAGENVVLVLDQMLGSYIAAFDRRNGELRWKIPREEMDGYATPLVYQPAGATAAVITASRGQLGAHRVDNGERLWSWKKLSVSEVASPILVDDTLFTFGYGNDQATPFSTPLRKYDKNQDGKLTPNEYGDDAYLKGVGLFVGNLDGIVTQEEYDFRQSMSVAPSSLLAIQLGADTAAVPREIWRYEKSFVAVVPSPLYYQGVLYVLKNGGLLTSFDPRTGSVEKAGRVAGALGGYSSSPVAAEGRIYIASEEGKVTVLKAGADWDVIQINDLDEGCYATPALADGNIYLRTTDALYRFGMIR
jgi:outer membrane protein assembly factor BamB